LAIISYFCLKGLGNNIHSRIVFQLAIIFLIVLLIGNISTITSSITLTTNSFQEQSFLDNNKQESEAEVEKKSAPLNYTEDNTQQELFNSQNVKLPSSAQTDIGVEEKNKNNWIMVNHDIYGTRSSNQTIIGKHNLDNLQVKWRLVNNVEIQDPPIIIGNRGYVQDYDGNVLAFDTRTGDMIWKIRAGNGPTMGLTFDHAVIFASTASNATIMAINATDGKIIWESQVLGDPKLGYKIDPFPIVWRDYVIAGSGGGSEIVKGNVTALNRTNGKIIWNFDTTTGEWVKPGKSPPNGGVTAWSGGSLDPETGIIYIPLGNAAPYYNATTRQTPNLYSNHIVALNITNGKIVWTTPFVAHGTVLNVKVPDTHDWDTSWGSSITKVTLNNGTQKKVVVGHDKMGNVIAMDAATGKEIWWKTLGKQYRTDVIPLPNGSGIIWSYGVFTYHAVDSDTLYITGTNRSLNYFTDGINGRVVGAPDTFGLGSYNGTIMALDLITGKIKWQYQTEFPPRVSPLVTDDIVFAGYIPYMEKTKSGVILALDKQTGKKLWEFDVNAPIGQVGPSIGDGMLFVPTGKGEMKDTFQGLPKGEKIRGSIVAFGLP
jgi:alcohol dehydrogenase (cytochrome c)